MKFFETYFTRHHFVHTPHKWFAALLLSPIHAAELHYKLRYHLTFAHAKKLFAIDMMLLASMVVLLGATIFWFLYDPGVTDLVRLSFSSSEERVKSGDYVTFTLTYKNMSDVILESPSISFKLPPGFVLDGEKAGAIDPVQPKQEGTETVSGWFYGQPGEEISTVANFSYTQPMRTIRESKTVRLLSILRGSVLETELQAPRAILQSGAVPITITFKNTGDRALPPLRIPFGEPQAGIRLKITSSTMVDTVAPAQTITLHGTLTSELPSNLEEATYTLVPSLFVSSTTIPQVPITASFSVVHPFIETEAGWSAAYGKPRENSVVTFTLTNKGNADLKNIEVSLDIPIPIVDIGAFGRQNTARIEGNRAIFNSTGNPTLATIPAGQSVSFPVVVPIKSSPQGTDVVLNLNSAVTAQVEGVPEGSYQTTVTSASLPIGTNINMGAELRYYTDEGDQLGRGPLPPVVGKETKYWALIQITNASSDVEDVRFRATLPGAVAWTGRTSVSHGKDITFDAKSRTISWDANEIAAHTTVGLYIELALTPGAGMVGMSPVLVKDLVVTGKDAFINQSLTASSRALDISIPTDEIGRQKGSAVAE